MNYDQWKLMSDRDDNSYADFGLDSSDVESLLERYGCTEVNVTTCSDSKTVDIGFAYDGIYYYHNDLCQFALWWDMSFDDIIKEADDSETACCGASYDDDHRRCHYCKEAF